MLSRTTRLISAAVLGLAMTAGIGGTQAAQASPAPAPNLGPPYEYQTVLMHPNVIPMYRSAMITRTGHGYLFRAGVQNSHLVIRLVKGGVRFTDTRSRALLKLAPGCRERNVPAGVSAVCRVPAGVTRSRPLLLEIWPRLGNDFVDGSSLPARIAMTVLADDGHDTVRVGAGSDYVNGATGNDRVEGGAGNDWIRTGPGADTIWGGRGNDFVVGVEGDDIVAGGPGDDRVGGGPGNDRLFGGPGRDFILCGDGVDSAGTDATDRVMDCEALRAG